LTPPILCYQIWKTNENWRIVEKRSKSGWKRLSGDYRALGDATVAGAEVKPKPPRTSEMIKNYVGFIQNFLLSE
jgi:hypothetical protein